MMAEAKVIDSILNSIKDGVGVEESETAFDSQIIMHINAMFSTLYQLGIGPKEPFRISDETAVWDDFITRSDTENVKSYMKIKVGLMFDPPATATMYNALVEQAKELEWRLTVVSDEEVQNGS